MEINGVYDISTTECSCGCGILKLSQENWDGHEIIFIDYYPSGFYAYQDNWKTKLKNIWRILTGKEYQLYEVVLDNPEEIANFKQNLRDFLEKN